MPPMVVHIRDRSVLLLVRPDVVRRNVELVTRELLDRPERLHLKGRFRQPLLPAREADQLELDPDEPIRLGYATREVLESAARLPEPPVLPHGVFTDRECR